MSRHHVLAPKNWGNETVGLFFHEHPFRLDEVCDYGSWRWTKEAACVGVDPDAFFETDKQADLRLIQEICTSCPVRAECLEHALDNDEHGFWAGLSRKERRKLAKIRPYGAKIRHT